MLFSAFLLAAVFCGSLAVSAENTSPVPEHGGHSDNSTLVQEVKALAALSAAAHNNTPYLPHQEISTFIETGLYAFNDSADFIVGAKFILFCSRSDEACVDLRPEFLEAVKNLNKSGISNNYLDWFDIRKVECSFDTGIHR